MIRFGKVTETGIMPATNDTTNLADNPSFRQQPGNKGIKALLQNLWVNLDAVPARNLAMAPDSSAGQGNANRRIVRISSPWLAATVPVPDLVSPGLPEKRTVVLNSALK